MKWNEKSAHNCKCVRYFPNGEIMKMKWKCFLPLRVLRSLCSPLFFYFVSFNQFQFFKYSIQVWVLRAILTPQLSYILITFEWQPKELGTFWLNCQLERRTKSAHKHRVYIYTFYIPCILMLAYEETCSNLRIDLCQGSLSEKNHFNSVISLVYVLRNTLSYLSCESHIVIKVHRRVLSEFWQFFMILKCYLNIL